MIRLPEGTPKYLLLDHKVIDRNSQRRRGSAPVAVVYHVQEDGTTVRYLGHGVVTMGPAELSYAPHGFVVNRHRDKHRAAYSTTSAVDIAEYEGEEWPSIPTPPEVTADDFVDQGTATAREPKAPTTKAKKTK